MVLVALVGLGLGIFQLFHLQKELANSERCKLLWGIAVDPECAEVGMGVKRPAAVGEEGDRNPWTTLGLQHTSQSFLPVLE